MNNGATDILLRRYFWSGDKLEWMYNGSTAYYYVVDGNKNVTALVDSSGNIAAEYSYDPFGKIVAQSGAMADVNPFRFSSEYFDVETGLIYYNFRYYSPDLRRWLSRDPIGERGGVNLYAMVNNNPVNKWDRLGLEGCYCGKDITASLDRLMHNLEESLKNNPGYKGAVCNYKNLYDPEYGWDIEELYSAGNKGGNDVFKCGGKDQGNKCSKTVMVSGKCYKVWAVNYYLFGRINSLCGEDVGTVTSAIAGYRLKKLFYGFINADEGIDPSEGEDWSRGMSRGGLKWATQGRVKTGHYFN